MLDNAVVILYCFIRLYNTLVLITNRCIMGEYILDKPLCLNKVGYPFTIYCSYTVNQLFGLEMSFSEVWQTATKMQA